MILFAGVLQLQGSQHRLDIIGEALILVLELIDGDLQRMLFALGNHQTGLLGAESIHEGLVHAFLLGYVVAKLCGLIVSLM